MSRKARWTPFTGLFFIMELQQVARMATVLHITVTPEESGQKLLQFLQRRLGKDVPKAAIMRWIRTGQVRLNKGRVKPFDRLDAGDIVRVPPFHSDTASVHCDSHNDNGATAADGISPNPIVPSATQDGVGRLAKAGLPVAATAEGLLILRKPAGLPVQPGTGHTDAVTTRLAACFANAPFMPTPAHRLDRDTSGLLLVATSYARLQSLHTLFRNEHAIGKYYLAWVQGDWPDSGPRTLHDTLAKRATSQEPEGTGTGGRGREKVLRLNTAEKHSAAQDNRKGAETAREASCTVVPVLRTGKTTLLAIRLHTGRTHQIRVQLSGRGFPILGDRKYGGPACPQGMLLHAWKLVLPGLAPESDRPEDFATDQAFTCLPEWTAPFTITDDDLAGCSF
jgi:23S rRNA pseudouridine955/2504/2580 synthase